MNRQRRPLLGRLLCRLGQHAWDYYPSPRFGRCQRCGTFWAVWWLER